MSFIFSHSASQLSLNLKYRFISGNIHTFIRSKITLFGIAIAMFSYSIFTRLFQTIKVIQAYMLQKGIQ